MTYTFSSREAIVDCAQRAVNSANSITSGTFTIHKINSLEIEGSFSATMGTMGYLDGPKIEIEDGTFRGKFIN